MLDIGIQFFGGRGGGGSGGARGSGRAGGGASDQAKMDRLTAEGMSVQAAQQYLDNEKEIASLQRELQAEMSSSESNHSVGCTSTVTGRTADRNGRKWNVTMSCTGGVSMQNNAHEKMGKGVKFERIRRITGYLTGSLSTWNDAKKAEERDRVKHSMEAKK